MNKLPIIVRREYLAIVASKSFVVMTIISPLILILCIALPIAIEHFNNQMSEQLTITVIDQSAQHYGQSLKSHDQYKYVQLTAQPTDKVNAKRFYDKADGQTSAVVVIPHNVDSTMSVTVYSGNTISASLLDDITNSLNDTITYAKIASYGIPRLQQIINEAEAHVDVRSVKWDENGTESDSSTEAAMVFGMVLALAIYMFILSYGAMVMNCVIEEKTNRIVEVMVGSCKPFQLMMGKIIGVGLAGITQFAIWGIALGVLGAGATAIVGVNAAPSAAAVAAATGSDSFVTGALQAALSINYLPILVCFVLYFAGGYLLYASLFSAFGASVDQSSDAAQFMTPLMLIMIVALYAGMACIQNPNGPMAIWCSMIPFTSPIVMMVRLPYDVPLWQLATSITLLFATAAAIVWLSGRIYRTGILLYGKKHSFIEILKWIRHS